MKKLLTTSFMLAMLCYGCKKDEPQVSEKLYDINFSLPDFSTEIIPLSKGEGSVNSVGDTLSNYVNSLDYQLYTSDGRYVKSIHQTTSNSDFGTIGDALPAGTYTAVFIAYYNINTAVENTTQPLSSLYLRSVSPYWDNSYLKTISFTVSSSPISQEVRLDRVGGAIMVTLEETLPQNVNRIVFELSDEISNFYPHGTSVYAVRSKTFTQPGAIRPSGLEYPMHIYNIYKPFTLKIRALDVNGTVLAEKTVNNVMCYHNKKTLLSGKLFSSSTATFSIKVNPVWDTPTPVITF